MERFHAPNISLAWRFAMSEPRQQAPQKAEDFLTPASFIRAAKAAHPAFRYALAVAGILAIVVSFVKFGVGPATVVFGAIAMIGLMVLFLLFAQASKLTTSTIDLPAQVLVWAFLVIAIAIVILLTGSVFFNRPLPLRDSLVHGALSAPTVSSAQTQPAASSSSSPRVRVNTPSQSSSLFTKIRGKLVGFNLAEDDLVGTEWTVETTAEDPTMSRADAHGRFQFYRFYPCAGACGALDLKLTEAQGPSAERHRCNFAVANDSVHIECPNIEILVRSTYELHWNGVQLIGTEHVFCGESNPTESWCPPTGFYLQDVRLTRLH